jgi:Tfp pilus assembly protein PilN
MSFFRIDLNKLEDPGLALRKERREGYVFVALAALFAALLAWASRSTADLGGKLRELRGLRADLQAQLEALQRDSQYVSEDDVRSLFELERRRVLWTRKLNALPELVGDKIVLTDVRYERGLLTVQGLAEAPAAGNRFELVSAFIDRLKASPDFGRDFGKVEFQSSHRLDFQGQNLLSFAVLCRPK